MYWMCTTMNTYNVRKMIRTVYNHTLDSSEILDHWDSMISWKIIRPIKNAIYEYRETRRLKKVNYDTF